MDTHGAEGARKRVLDLTGKGSEPMADNPALLHFITKQDFPDDKPRVIFPRRNAVVGRWRVMFYCQDCVSRGPGRKAAIRHAATEGHVVKMAYSEEICPVDQEDDWRDWADGAGVSWWDRHPDADDGEGVA